MEHPHRCAIANHQQWLAENGNRAQIAFRRGVGRQANAKPRLLENGTAFELEYRLVGEMPTGKPLLPLYESRKVLGRLLHRSHILHQ
jgi:hypothetical protein